MSSRPNLDVDDGTGTGWGAGLPRHVQPAGDPTAPSVALEWPLEQRNGKQWLLLLTPWILGPLAAVVVVAVSDLDAPSGSGGWLLLAGAGVLVCSALVAGVALLARTVTLVRDQAVPDQVEGTVVLRAIVRPRGGDGSEDQQSHYLAVDDGSRPVQVYRSTSWFNSKVQLGDRVRLLVGPRRRKVLSVHPAQ